MDYQTMLSKVMGRHTFWGDRKAVDSGKGWRTMYLCQQGLVHELCHCKKTLLY